MSSIKSMLARLIERHGANDDLEFRIDKVVNMVLESEGKI